MANNEEGVEQMNRKQKKKKVPSMYDEATARKILQEVVLVPAERTQDGEAVIGFDPDNEALDNRYMVLWVSHFYAFEITPMIYFARKGDLKMCRYLVSRGASTTKESSCGFWCPMYAAASRGHLDVCKFLFANGGKNGIRRVNAGDWTPVAAAALNEHHAVVRWLVLEGALCANDSSEVVEGGRLYPKIENSDLVSRNLDRKKVDRSRERLVEWAEEITQCHASIITFLQGTLPPAPGTDGRSDLQCLSGHPGIREHICDFVGREVTKKRHLHILRQVKDALPPLDE